MRRRLEAAGQPLDIIRQVEQDSAELEGDLIAVPPPTTRPVDESDGDQPQFRLGDLVWVVPLNAEGQIAELTETDAEVTVGRLRMRARLEDLMYRSKTESKRDAKSRRGATEVRGAARTREQVSTRGASPGLELDLRGQIVEDAVPTMEDYLDAAYMAGMPFVRIIHGKGTGVLRTAIRDRLHGHPLVKRYERGGPKEGGDGVTVVSLVEQA